MIITEAPANKQLFDMGSITACKVVADFLTCVKNQLSAVSVMVCSYVFLQATQIAVAPTIATRMERVSSESWRTKLPLLLCTDIGRALSLVDVDPVQR